MKAFPSRWVIVSSNVIVVACACRVLTPSSAITATIVANCFVTDPSWLDGYIAQQYEGARRLRSFDEIPRRLNTAN
jgi:hypothetical protein